MYSARAASVVLLSVLCVGCFGADSPTAPADTPDVLVASSMQAAINSYRTERGLPALTQNAVLAEQALKHSQDMAAGRTPVGHVDLSSRQAAVCATLPCGTVSENVASASCQSSPADAMARGLFASASHRDAIVGDWEQTGVGVASAVQGGCRVYYFTQLFYGRQQGGARAR